MLKLGFVISVSFRVTEMIQYFLIFSSYLITEKNVLPNTRLNFGRTQLESSSCIHTLGRLLCSMCTDSAVALTRMPPSCRDLWLIGHTLNGFYSIWDLRRYGIRLLRLPKVPAPRSGIYSFAFTGSVELPAMTSLVRFQIYLFKNGDGIGILS